MKFTFKSYKQLIDKILKNGYQITTYQNYDEYLHPCILRHDVDMDLDRAVKFAELESKYGGGGIKSVYFILVSSNFYNIMSKQNQGNIRKILAMGHGIGLHFDEKKYTEELQEYSSAEEKISKIQQYVQEEAEILGKAAGQKITEVSMHRPSKETLEADIEFPGIINSYSRKFFNDFKYVSDSRMYWREDVEKIVSSNEYRALHILTHPFWYSETEETMRDKLYNYFSDTVQKTYETLDDNFRDLEEIILKKEIDIN